MKNKTKPNFCPHCKQGEVIPTGKPCGCRDIFYQVEGDDEWHRWPTFLLTFSDIAEVVALKLFDEEGYSIMDEVEYVVRVRYRDGDGLRKFKVECYFPEPDAECTSKEIA